MATITIPYLTTRPGRHGTTRHYWQPSAALKKAGWQMVNLGTDQAAAIKAAQKLNDQVAAWKAGGEATRKGVKAAAATVCKFQPRGTLGELITAYRRERLPLLGDSTQATYGYSLDILDQWAGDAPITTLSRKRVQVLKTELGKPAKKGGPDRLTRAATTMRVARTLFKWGQDNDMVGENPFAQAGVETPAPRHHVWSPEARAAFMAAAGQTVTANSVTYPPDDSLALGMVLGFAIGQREGDILRLQHSQFVDVPPHKIRDREVWDHISSLSPDGTVKGIRIRQGKTQRWIEVPVVGEVRAAVEAAIARARAASCTTILIDERTNRPWEGQSGAARFQRRFAEIRDRAIATATKAGDQALADELGDLQFRDLRRTAVVFLGELDLADHEISAITGHKLASVKKILETYMPRTSGHAARAVSLSHQREQRDANRKEQQG